MSIGEALITARQAKGWTQEELARKAGVSQAALSRYEHGHREPEPDVLPRLADALGVTPRLLQEAQKLRGAIAVDAHMRRRMTAKPTVWKQLEAKLNLYRMQAHLLYTDVSLRAENRVATWDPIDTPPADAARMTRMQWRVPIGPVRQLIEWVESAGVLIIEEDFGTARVDGMSQWIGPYPIMFLNSVTPTDRKRLTVGHELGHLCLHTNDVTDDVEAEANAFAAEFLMPADVIRYQLRNLTLAKLQDLKREWGVSMQALIERAKDLRMITPAQRTNLYKSLSYKGWRIHEPISEELPPEHAVLPQRIADALVHHGFSSEDIARMAGTADRSTDHPFRPTISIRKGLRLVQ